MTFYNLQNYVKLIPKLQEMAVQRISSGGHATDVSRTLVARFVPSSLLTLDAVTWPLSCGHAKPRSIFEYLNCFIIFIILGPV